VSPFRDNVDIISHRIVLVNSFLKTFSKIFDFFINRSPLRDSLHILPHLHRFVKYFLKKSRTPFDIRLFHF